MAFTVKIAGAKTLQCSMALTGQNALAESGLYDPERHVVAWRVNHYLRSLLWTVDDDASVEFVDTSSFEGASVYRNSLSFLLIIACHRALNREICVRHSLSDGLFWELEGEQDLTPEMVQAVEEEMYRIIDMDLPFVREVLSLDKVRQIFERQGVPEKARLLSHVVVDPVEMFGCLGEYDCFFAPMVPSTGYLKTFALCHHGPGMLLRYPTVSSPRILPDYQSSDKLSKVFLEYASWLKTLGVTTMEHLHEVVARGRGADLILLAEALHAQRFSELASEILAGGRRFVTIAGPSASGKTTTAQKLRIQLMVAGHRTVTLSLDDYFLNRDKSPVDEQGRHDFEALEALDLELLEHHFSALLEGKKIRLPKFNFLSGCREEGPELWLGPDDIVILEGLHGLNDTILNMVPLEYRFGIFASPLTGVNLDKHNRIGTTDNRLLRRMVRDSWARGNSAEDTLTRWPSVICGGMKYIFPYQKNADAMFNSSLIYEIPVLKSLSEPLLRSIEEDSPVFGEAQRLLGLLKFAPSLSVNLVPNNSILREFVGGSIIDSK